MSNKPFALINITVFVVVPSTHAHYRRIGANVCYAEFAFDSRAIVADHELPRDRVAVA